MQSCRGGWGRFEVIAFGSYGLRDFDGWTARITIVWTVLNYSFEHVWLLPYFVDPTASTPQCMMVDAAHQLASLLQTTTAWPSPTIAGLQHELPTLIPLTTMLPSPHLSDTSYQCRMCRYRYLPRSRKGSLSGLLGTDASFVTRASSASAPHPQSLGKRSPHLPGPCGAFTPPPSDTV